MNEPREDSTWGEWERRLRQQRSDLDPALRPRVLDTVRRELHGERQPAVKWRRWLAAAAAYLAWLHCAWSAAQAGRSLDRIASRREIDERADQIRQLAPELSRQEAQRQAILFSVELNPTFGTIR